MAPFRPRRAVRRRAGVPSVGSTLLWLDGPVEAPGGPPPELRPSEATRVGGVAPGAEAWSSRGLAVTTAGLSGCWASRNQRFRLLGGSAAAAAVASMVDVL